MKKWFLYPTSILFISLISIGFILPEDKEWTNCSNEDDLYRYINEDWKVDKVVKNGDVVLNKNGVSIWDEWADENGDLGPVYGSQWRSWPTRDGGSIDQLLKVVQDIKSNPNSRRMIVSAWNPEYVEEMALPPCHCLFQFYVADNKLSCQLYQRSADIFLGVPFNIASYSLLTEMIAKSCGLEASEFIITLGDAHLYDNHKEQANLQIKRELKNLPILKINKKDNIENYIYDDFEIIDYNPHPHISGKVAV